MMNAQMRRYLDDDWESEEASERPERETKTTKNIAQDRRQIEKQRGKAIAKYHRDTAKLKKQSGN